MASFGVDDPSFLPSLSLRATAERVGRARLVHKADKISCTPISKRTNQRTNEREGDDRRRRRFRDTKDDLSVRSLCPPILLFQRPVTVSPWPPLRGSTVRPLDGAVMPVHDAWDFLRLFEGRVQLSLSSRIAGMLLDDGGGVGHSHLWSWSLQKGRKIKT